MAAGFIAVIEVASDRINGVAGVKNTNGSIDVKAAVSADASSFVDRGVIYNLNQAAECFTSVVRNLELSLNAHVEKVYTGIGGQSLHTVRNAITRTLTSRTVISKEIIESIVEQNTASFHSEEWELLEVIPQEYKTGGREEIDPVGMIDSRIEGNYLNVIARKELKKNLSDSFHKANIPCADIFISPLLLAKTILTDNEKWSGSILVDFQYDTTTVAVYQRNILRHLAVLPLGEKNILLDIVNIFNVEESEAKDLLQQHGDAYCEEVDLNKKSLLALSDGRAVEKREFSETVEARCQEIIANIWNQLNVSGFEESQLRCGAVFTGRACGIRNLDKAFQNYKKDSQIKVRIQKTLPITVTDTSHKLDGNCNIALSILLAGKEICTRENSDTLFPSQDTNKQVVEPKQPSAEEIRRLIEEEQKEKAFQEACDEARKLINEDLFKDAQKKINELKGKYPDRTANIESIEIALRNRKKSKPGLFQKWGAELTRLKEKGKDFLGKIGDEE